jgi:hypothetical protein
MTTKDFIKKLDFEYIETFSLLRELETKDYVDNLQAKAKTVQGDAERRRLLDLTVRGTKKLIIETGTPHPTAQRTNIFKKSHPRIDEFFSILSEEYTEQYEFMCWPVFREMIVFYDKSNQIVSLLSICLSCDKIEDEEANRIRTDFKVFDKLRKYFKDIGHKVERM